MFCRHPLHHADRLLVPSVQSWHKVSRAAVLRNFFLLRRAEVFIDPFAHVPYHTCPIIAHASKQHVVRTESNLVHFILVTFEAVPDIRTVSAIYINALVGPAGSIVVRPEPLSVEAASAS
jgi:hypothetical protein